MERDWILRLAILTKFIAPSVMVFLNHWHRPEGTDIYSTKLGIEYYGKSFDFLIWFWVFLFGFWVFFWGWWEGFSLFGLVYLETLILLFAALQCWRGQPLLVSSPVNYQTRTRTYVTLFQLMDKVAEVFLFGW